ncbi:MAG TPA: exodeoxyribonuclease VII small subunit [Candidatus Binatia bacterium]|nr:exodeoxyribonuclease VII small subunit [Candidatus Binatia bacterium]
MAAAAPPDGGDVARFEQALGELEQIVGKLERGELKLEESLQLFERGVALAKQCRQSLETAELKVKQLLGDETGGPAA